MAAEDQQAHTNFTDFGFEQIPCSEKNEKVKAVFDSVADNYDLMNDLMSLGLHRIWKRFALAIIRPKAQDKILDLAAGTADLSLAMIAASTAPAKLFVSDINYNMLAQGRDKLINAGYVKNLSYVQANAEQLPFSKGYFNTISIGFGLRNVTNKLTALKEMYRCLAVGGKLVILEFSQPTVPLFSKIYDLYSFKLLPRLGGFIAKDQDSYRYLVESIRKHPAQAALKALLLEAGFDQVSYYNLTLGIVAVHVAYKY